MVSESEGVWPWERDAMPVASEAAPESTKSELPLYTLPSVRDRRAEGGRRPATVRDLVRLRREQGARGAFRW